MADKNCAETSSSSQVSDENVDATVLINVKTLDSQVYPFRVSKNMTVLMLKEKIADVTGTPVGQQRLIFRGKVLKDDHPLSAYHAEDGHTFHLVERQPVQSERQPATSSTGAVGNVENTGTGPAGGVPWNRVGVVGQVSHNVVLRPISIGDQTENIAPEINRIIGSVLSSMGLAPQTGGTDNSAPTSQPNSQTAPSNVTPLENHLPTSANLFPFPFFNQPQLPTPDSLTTLSSFISRLEQALELYGSQSPVPAIENPSSSANSGLPTPESLGGVMSQAQRLIHGKAAAALSHIAGQLERQRSSTDPALRAEIQRQATHVGVAMQHLGAMLMELGRATLTMRMSESPAGAFVNAGPPVYISGAGPSPMMVQVQPALHTTPLFGFSRSLPLAVRVGENTLGDLNIRVHSGGMPVESMPEDDPTDRSEPTQSAPLSQPPSSGSPPESESREDIALDTETSAAAPSVGSNQQATSLPAASSTASETVPPGSGSSSSAHQQPGRSASQAVVREGPGAEKKDVPLGLGLGGLQPKRRGKQPQPQPQSQSIAMGQQVLQTLVSQAEAGIGGGSSSAGPAAQLHQRSSGQTGEVEGFDFSRLFNQMMPIVSQALGVVGSPSGDRGAHPNDVHPRSYPTEEGISEVDVQTVVERLVSGASGAGIFRAMLESASRLYGQVGNHSEDLTESLSQDDELVDGFFEMLKKNAHQDGSGSGGSGL